MVEEFGVKEELTKRLKAKRSKKSVNPLGKYVAVFGLDQIKKLVGKLPKLPEFTYDESRDYVITDLTKMGELKGLPNIDSFIDKAILQTVETEVLEEISEEVESTENSSEKITKTIIVSGNYEHEVEGEELTKDSALRILQSIGLNPGTDVEIEESIENGVKTIEVIKKVGTKG
jgi:chaperonin GroEL (HSP60 family)